MATAKSVMVPPVDPVAEVHLVLSYKEARILVDILGMIGGDMSTRRGDAARIFDALVSVVGRGLSYNDTGKSGGIYFDN